MPISINGVNLRRALVSGTESSPLGSSDWIAADSGGLPFLNFGTARKVTLPNDICVWAHIFDL